jgi:hypothetical protein
MTIGCLALAAILPACAPPFGEESSAGKTQVLLRLEVGGSGGRAITSEAVASAITLQVTGPGMNRIEQTIERDSVDVTLAAFDLAVPAGESRVFEVVAFNIDGVPLYQGSLTTDVSGASVDLSVLLGKANGVAVVDQFLQLDRYAGLAYHGGDPASGYRTELILAGGPQPLTRSKLHRFRSFDAVDYVSIDFLDGSDSVDIDEGTYTLVDINGRGPISGGAPGEIPSFAMYGGLTTSPESSVIQLDVIGAPFHDSFVSQFGTDQPPERYSFVVAGTVTVERVNDGYTISWSFTDRFGERVSGFYSGPVEYPASPAPDAFEADDSIAQAAEYVVGTDGVQTRALESPSAVDYVRFNVIAGQTYLIKSLSTGGVDTDTYLVLTDSTPPDQGSFEVGNSSFDQLTYEAPNTETVYLSVTGEGLAQTGQYGLEITTGADVTPPSFAVPPSFSAAGATAGDTVTVTVELADTSPIRSANVSLDGPGGRIEKLSLSSADNINWEASFVVEDYFPSTLDITNIQAEDIYFNSLNTLVSGVQLSVTGVTEDTTPPMVDFAEFRIAGNKVTNVSSDQIFDIVVSASDPESGVRTRNSISVQLFNLDSGTPIGNFDLEYNPFTGLFESGWQITAPTTPINVAITEVQGLENLLGYSGTRMLGTDYASDALTVNP